MYSRIQYGFDIKFTTRTFCNVLCAIYSFCFFFLFFISVFIIRRKHKRFFNVSLAAARFIMIYFTRAQNTVNKRALCAHDSSSFVTRRYCASRTRTSTISLSKKSFSFWRGTVKIDEFATYARGRTTVSQVRETYGGVQRISADTDVCADLQQAKPIRPWTRCLF